jgi:hypothetical protein
MKVYNESRDMVFDDADPRCVVFFCEGIGGPFAFIQCLDLGLPESGHSVPDIKRYWGPWDSNAPETSMKHILVRGGKWPTLPPTERYEEHIDLKYHG